MRRKNTFSASRPRYCALANGKLAAAGIAMPAWQDALARAIDADQSRRAPLRA